MSHYNLIDEKWIPVRFHDGNLGELGIRDTLLRSREIAAIEDHSPLVVAALHRFLLAVLYRALEGPADIDEARALFNGQLPGAKITAYLEKWRDRLWLFDEKYPFGQNPNVPPDEIEPWTKLTAEYNASSNKVLFDHTDSKNPGVKPLNECARWLLSTMSFSIAGGRGYYPSPSPNAMMCIPLGRNLYETLCYCLVPYPNQDVMLGDSALWEREPAKLPLGTPKRTANGYADLYSWQSRMILLERTSFNEVTAMRFVAGHGFDNPSKNPDPMQPYRVDKTHGKLPVQFREDRGTWRDFDSLLPGDTDLAPMTIQHGVRLAGKDTDSMPKRVLVVGLRYEPPSANVEFWRMERFAMPNILAGDKSVRTEIKNLLTEATDSQNSLSEACSSFARDILSHGNRKVDEKDVKAFIKQMPLISWYWFNLEYCFHETLAAYTDTASSDTIRCQWLKYVRSTLMTAWDQHLASPTAGDPWVIRALVKAERPIRREIRELNEKILNLEPHSEGL